jgi:hypothetical protein
MYFFPIYHGKIVNLIIANAAMPGSPKNPAITVVNALIGIRKSKDVPIAFKRKSSNAPIASFTKACPIKRNGFNGAPMSRNKTMTPTNTDMTIIESNIKTPLHVFLHIYGGSTGFIPFT